MARKTPEQKLGALIQEMGFERAEQAFKVIKAYASKPSKKERVPKIQPELKSA